MRETTKVSIREVVYRLWMESWPSEYLGIGEAKGRRGAGEELRDGLSMAEAFRLRERLRQEVEESELRRDLQRKRVPRGRRKILTKDDDGYMVTVYEYVSPGKPLSCSRSSKC